MMSIVSKFKPVGQRYETTDYTIFKFIEGNRNRNQRGFNKIKKSIKQHGQWIDVVVNEDFYVIDGQHRLWACEESGVPVRFVIMNIPTEFISDIQCESEEWELKDFLNSMVKEGKASYITLNNIIKSLEDYFDNDKLSKYKLNISNYITIFSSDSQAGIDKFKIGDFTITQDRQRRGMEVIELYKLICEGESKKDFNTPKMNKTNALFRALAQVVEYKKFSMERMTRKMSQTYVERPQDNDVEAYINKVLKSYNHNEKLAKNKLFYNQKMGIH